MILKKEYLFSMVFLLFIISCGDDNLKDNRNIENKDTVLLEKISLKQEPLKKTAPTLEVKISDHYKK